MEAKRTESTSNLFTASHQTQNQLALQQSNDGTTTTSQIIKSKSSSQLKLAAKSAATAALENSKGVSTRNYLKSARKTRKWIMRKVDKWRIRKENKKMKEKAGWKNIGALSESHSLNIINVNETQIREDIKQAEDPFDSRGESKTEVTTNEGKSFGKSADSRIMSTKDNPDTEVGTSKWNPGKTFESRDYTKLVNEKWSTMMSEFSWSGSALSVDYFPKLAMDFSIAYARNKVRYIYDMSFILVWKGNVNGQQVRGTLSMSDIMSDWDEDEWEWNVTVTKNDSAHRLARIIVETSRPKIFANLQQLIECFKKKGG